MLIELKRGVRRAKRGHEMLLAGRIKENPKAFYSYVRKKRVVREKIGPLRDIAGELCLEPKEIGEILNEYFASVFTKEKDVLTGSVSEGGVDPLERISITREEVLGFLGTLKLTNPQDLMASILDCSERREMKLLGLWRKSLPLPEDWRIANVVPLFKKGSRDNPGNYRPVSLTSMVGKLLERILRDRMYAQLERKH